MFARFQRNSNTADYFTDCLRPVDIPHSRQRSADLTSPDLNLASTANLRRVTRVLILIVRPDVGSIVSAALGADGVEHHAQMFGFHLP